MHVFSRNGATAIGGVQVGQVVLTNQAVWVSANTLQIGNNLAKGSLIVDDSTFIGKNITLGKGTRHGETVVRNNGRLVLTNGYIYVNSGPSTVLTNLLV
jgi:pyrimidine deaminase RibD-like protein